jgi:hypothetical protein
MPRFHAVHFALLAVAALSAATACQDPPTQIRNCIDDNRHMVPDERCDNEPFTGSEILPGSYHYIYGGASGGQMGDAVVGGSWQPKFGARIISGDTGATVHIVSDGPPGTGG